MGVRPDIKHHIHERVHMCVTECMNLLTSHVRVRFYLLV